MTNIIKPKRSESSGAPTASDLAVGELAINLADGTIHSKKVDGTVVSLGSSSSSAGSITFASANDTQDFGDLTTFSHTGDLGSIAETENNGLTPTDLGLLHYDEIFRSLTVNISLTAMGLTYPTSDGSAGQFLKTDGSGTLSFATVSTDLVSDTTPQLGGDLDLNSNDITGTGNIDITGNTGLTGTTTQGATDFYTKQYVLYGTTTDATETEVLIGGSTRISVPSNTTMFYEVNIVSRRTDATGESGAWHLKGCADNFSGTVADVGDVYEIAVAQDDVNMSVDVRADDTNDAINVFVTGVASKTIRWTAIVKTIEVAQ
jgi:hypothetical protein